MLTYFSVYDIIMPKCSYAHDLLNFFNLLCSAGTCPAFIFCSGKNGNEKIKTFHFFKKKIINFKKE